MSAVDVTDPSNPVFVGDLPLTAGATPATWRDIKVYRDHAYVVADGSGEHGMQVLDLTKLRAFDGTPLDLEPDTTYRHINSAHNIVINEESGFAYVVGARQGGETCGGGLHMIDIRAPKNPTFAGCFSDPQTGRAATGYSHDAQCVTYRGPDERYRGREICLGANETALSIADVTDKEDPRALSRASYPSVAYSHQGWLDDDHRYFYMNDELDEANGLTQKTRTLIWDLADLEDPQLVSEHMGVESAIDHNLYVLGDLMYQSNYRSGLRILDISDRENPREVGFFKTFPGDAGVGFDGSWSNYPFFESGIIVVSSIGEGLFVVKKRDTTTVF
jgi:choice-of-anchor B domain-containing protein